MKCHTVTMVEGGPAAPGTKQNGFISHKSCYKKPIYSGIYRNDMLLLL